MELSCGIIGNKDDFLVLSITEEDYSEVHKDLPRLNCHEAKHDPNSPYNKIKTIKADIPNELRDAITKYSLNLFNLTGCRDYARVDWRLNRSGNPKLLEINPNPGWCWDGHLAKMCNLDGISYSQMLERIIKTAKKRLQ
jgi:D-alanine-D-alanine ligase